jgi:hypothetical protein
MDANIRKKNLLLLLIVVSLIFSTVMVKVGLRWRREEIYRDLMKKLGDINVLMNALETANRNMDRELKVTYDRISTNDVL